jgi:hypothetical protein
LLSPRRCRRAATTTSPPRARASADPAKARAQEAERQRLVAKLRADAPKVDDLPPAHPLAAPIFHRYERR